MSLSCCEKAEMKRMFAAKRVNKIGFTLDDLIVGAVIYEKDHADVARQTPRHGGTVNPGLAKGFSQFSWLYFQSYMLQKFGSSIGPSVCLNSF